MKDVGVAAERHEVGGRLNNRAENSHQPFRRRERAMQRFRSLETLQKFSSIHAQVHNQFNQERHLVARQVYKQRRSAALAERGIDISHETVRFWWNRFGPMFAAEIRKKRVAQMRGYPQWRWHLEEAFVKVNGKLCYLWRAVDHEGEVLEAVVTAKRDKAAALKLLKRIMKNTGLLAASSPMGFGHIRRQ